MGIAFNGLVIGGDSYPDPGRVPDNARQATQLFHNLPRSLYRSQNKFSPRIGLVYDLTGKGTTVFRSGVAIYYDRLAAGRSVEAGGNPPFTNTVTLFDGKLDDPSSGKASAQFPVAVTSVNPNITAPTTYNWNVGIQRKIFFNSILEVNYVSTQGRHLLRRPDLNQVTPAVQNANRTVNINALRPYQGYTTIRLYESGASSCYNGLQVGLTRRYKSSFTYSLAYTRSKVLTDSTADGTEPESNLDFRRERSYASFDRNHVFVVTHVYRIPGFRNQRSFLGYFAGGWDVSASADAVWSLADPNYQHADGARAGPTMWDPRNISIRASTKR